MKRTEHVAFGMPSREPADLDFFATRHPVRYGDQPERGSSTLRLGETVLASVDAEDLVASPPPVMRVARKVLAIAVLCLVLLLLGVARLSDLAALMHLGGDAAPASAGSGDAGAAALRQRAPALPRTLLQHGQAHRAGPARPVARPGVAALARAAQRRNHAAAAAAAYRTGSGVILRVIAQAGPADVDVELLAAGVEGRQIFLRHDVCGRDGSGSLVCVRSGAPATVTVRARLPLAQVAAATDQAWAAATRATSASATSSTRSTTNTPGTTGTR